jgi:uncharacterized protein with PIN domain
MKCGPPDSPPSHSRAAIECAAGALTGPDQIRFAVDRMLGRLARMLRLLGYDTAYSPDTSTAELNEVAQRGERVVLTRGVLQKRFSHANNVVRVGSEYTPEQLREVVQRFRLDARTGLWTRCTLCNAAIERVDKVAVQHAVAPKVFQIYDEFFRCTGCGHLYWRGSHVERITKNLGFLLCGCDPDRG